MNVVFQKCYTEDLCTCSNCVTLVHDILGPLDTASMQAVNIIKPKCYSIVNPSVKSNTVLCSLDNL